MIYLQYMVFNQGKLLQYIMMDTSTNTFDGKIWYYVEGCKGRLLQQQSLKFLVNFMPSGSACCMMTHKLVAYGRLFVISIGNIH